MDTVLSRVDDYGQDRPGDLQCHQSNCQKKKKMSYMPANWRVLPGSVLKCQPARGVYVDTAKHKTSDDDSGLNL